MFKDFNSVTAYTTPWMSRTSSIQLRRLRSILLLNLIQKLSKKQMRLLQLLYGYGFMRSSQCVRQTYLIQMVC